MNKASIYFIKKKALKDTTFSWEMKSNKSSVLQINRKKNQTWHISAKNKPNEKNEPKHIHFNFAQVTISVTFPVD